MAAKEYTTEITTLSDVNRIYQGRSNVDRFWQRVNVTSEEECWEWAGSKLPAGYGTFNRMYAHRFSYILAHGSLSNALVIDHLCRNPSCVNPKHLEAVPQRINMLRGLAPAAQRARQTHCKNGHLFDKENTYFKKNGTRRCRKCLADHQANYRKTDKWHQWNIAREKPVQNILCAHGHELEGENVRYTPSGRRRCVTCYPPKTEQPKISRAHKDKTHCKYGHAFTEENTHIRKDASRSCRMCNKEKLQKYRQTPQWKAWYEAYKNAKEA